MLTKIQTLIKEFIQALEAVKDQKELEDLRIHYLSRNGSVAALFEEMKTASKEEKPVLGKELNLLRKIAEEKFNEKKSQFDELLTKQSQQTFTKAYTRNFSIIMQQAWFAANKENLIPKLNIKETKDLITKGIATGGMIPKLNCALDALSQGVKTVHIFNGTMQHAILLEIFTDQGVGTLIEP